VKRIRGDEPIGVVIHVCVETSQGNSLCSYLYLKLVKMSFFLFIFYLFSSTKSENRRAEQVLPRRRVGPTGSGEIVQKEGRRTNAVQIMNICVCKCKNDTC
jgi:hypothetical protein